MLRRFLNFGSTLVGRPPLAKWRPAYSALDSFCFEVPLSTTRAPFIRDAIDLKRWMMVVVYALFPCLFMALFNTGLQKMVFTSHDSALMNEFNKVSDFSTYFRFIFSGERFITILKLGTLSFLPVMLISYMVGGLCEMVVAVLRKHEISEGFLVTGLLYPLILPPTIPYWMAAVGIAFGVIFGKELFGGTGMNILNPALTARAFLFFTFPGKMTGDVWVGTNPTEVTRSLAHMNVDGLSQATPLGILNATPPEITRFHIDSIASGVTEIGLNADQFSAASQFSEVVYGNEKFCDWNLFFGNKLGAMGETSVFACLLGAFILIYTGIGAWRTMLSFGIFAFLTATLFEYFGGSSAKFMIPAYRHLMMGGLAFGLVYMATDPVSSPTMNLSKWIYGGLIGCVTIIIRLINPAFPEGVMLAILFGNVFAPLIDHLSLKQFRRKRVL
jgi:Na+-transporting NADH:ubiquinone oxidoreductase subunit B